MQREELERIMETYGRDLFSFCCFVTRDRQDAEELYQDTFLKLYESREKLHIDRNAKSFLMSVALNLYRNDRRKRSVRERIAGAAYSAEESGREVPDEREDVEERVITGEFVQDGVMYRLVQTDNVEMFADRGIYVGVNSGTFYDAGAYRYDENTGEMTCSDDYSGVNVLFTLPIDPERADSAAAAAYLEQ